MTRQELIESLVQWTHNTGVTWEFGFEDEGFVSVIFPYDMEEDDDELYWPDPNYPPVWERPVLEALVDGILKRGFAIEVRCGGTLSMDSERMYGPGTDKLEIFSALAAGDDDVIVLHKDGKISGVFNLIYNNGSEDDPLIVIQNYSVHEWCEEIMGELPQ